MLVQRGFEGISPEVVEEAAAREGVDEDGAVEVQAGAEKGSSAAL